MVRSLAGGAAVGTHVATDPMALVQRKGSTAMKMIVGVLLIALGVFALCYQGFTFFTTERAAEIGPLAIDVQKPHTIIFHPVLGVAALVVGGLIVMSDRKRALV